MDRASYGSVVMYPSVSDKGRYLNGDPFNGRQESNTEENTSRGVPLNSPRRAGKPDGLGNIDGQALGTLLPPMKTNQGDVSGFPPASASYLPR